MAYEKQTWNTGDVITAEKLNHIEDGIENSSVAVYTYHGDETDDVDTLYDFITNNYGKKLIYVKDEDWGFSSSAVIDAYTYIFSEQRKHAVLYVFSSDGESLIVYTYSNNLNSSEPNKILRDEWTIAKKNN